MLGFEKPTHEEWLEKINKDLKDKKAIEDLDYVVDNIKFSNFILNNGSTQIQPLEGFLSKSTIMCFGDNTEDKNKNALQSLEWGVESLAFEVSSDEDMVQLFDGIYLNMVDVLCYLDKKTDNVKDYNLRGKNIYILEKESPSYLCLNEEETITERIQKFKKHIDSTEVETLFLDVYLKEEFLPQIAELRAIRRLWALVKNQGKLHVITHIPNRVIKNEDIHPLIVCNYLIMSARIGMADFVMGLPYNSDPELTRLSINIQHVLTEESRFSEVLDPTAGSYLIEEMTEMFVNL